MQLKTTPEDEETRYALGRGVAIVFVPGFLLVFGLLWLVWPALLPLTAALGCYKLPELPMIRISGSKFDIDYPGQRSRAATIGYGKPNLVITTDTGFDFVTRADGTIGVVDANPKGQLTGVIKRRNQRSALTLAYPKEIPQVDCPT